jgi:hypothetical protein
LREWVATVPKEDKSSQAVEKEEQTKVRLKAGSTQARNGASSTFFFIQRGNFAFHV